MRQVPVRGENEMPAKPVSSCAVRDQTGCVEKEMRPEHHELLADLLERAGADARPEEFRRYCSARQLYTFNIDNASSY